MFKSLFFAAMVALSGLGASVVNAHAITSVEHSSVASPTYFEVEDFSFDIEQ